MTPGDPHRPAASAPPARTEVAALTDEVRRELVERKVTCPFLAPAVATGALPVRNDAVRPLASIDDVKALGATGGGDLGEVFERFAQGNHGLMPGASGALDQPVPPGYFSLDLSGSRGSHTGHSGILQGDPTVPNSGRFSEADFQRLVGRAKNGVLSRKDFAAFIAENLERDPKSTVLSVGQLLGTTFGIVVQSGPALIEWLKNAIRKTDEGTEERELAEQLTSGARASDIVGSAGEFGLLMAFLQHKPGAPTVDGDPAVSVEDVTLMFKEKRLPHGWETWPKRKKDWTRHTLALAQAAGKEYFKRTHREG
jgi:hypothetical protein